MPAAIIDDDNDLDTAVDTAVEDDGNTPDPVDDGNTPDTPEQIAAANDARAKALKQVAGAEDDHEQRDQRIPKSRFDEVNNERKTLAEQLAQANAALAALATAQTKTAEKAADPAPEFDVKAARKARLAALASGDDDLALEWDEKIESHQLRVATEAAIRVVQESQQQLTARQEAAALAETAKSMKEKYPELDEKGADADPDAIDFVVAKRNAFIAAGKPAHVALQEAVDVAVKRLGLGKQDAPAPTKEDPAAARLAAAREKNAKAANQQPPDLGGRGERAVATSRKVEDMTDAELRALPKAEFNRLAGNA